MGVFAIKRNDTSPALRVVLKDSDGVVVSLAGALGVQFHMRTKSGTVVVDAAASVVGDGSTGTCEYAWSGTDTQTAGSYEYEFEVTYSDSTVETFPNAGNNTLNIYEDIA